MSTATTLQAGRPVKIQAGYGADKGVGSAPPALSKRTGLYAPYAHINNRKGAGYTVANNTEAGSGHTGYNLGLRHTF